MSGTFATGLAILCGLFLIFVVLRVRRGTSEPISRVEDLESRLETVDLAAFQNLVDPAENRMLQETLSPKVYRRIQRLRIRAAVAYVEAVYRNAGLTIRLAENLLRSPLPEIRDEAMRIQALSIESRFLVVRSLVKLITSFVFPGLNASVRDVADKYARVADRVEAVCMLTAPLHTSRISAAFR